jgi:hypothetical protein
MTDDNNRTTNDLAEPLLSPQHQQDDDPLLLRHQLQHQQERPQHGENDSTVTDKRDIPSGDATDANTTTTTTTPTPFTIQNEIVEMLHLALPLAVSFFCRMGMASTDRCVSKRRPFEGWHVCLVSTTYTSTSILAPFLVFPSLFISDTLVVPLSVTFTMDNTNPKRTWPLLSCRTWYSVFVLPHPWRSIKF